MDAIDNLAQQQRILAFVAAICIEFVFPSKVAQLTHPTVCRFLLPLKTKQKLLAPHMAVSAGVTSFFEFGYNNVEVGELNV